MIKPGYNVAKAETELAACRDDDATSEMAYNAWTEIDSKLDVALTHIARIGQERAKKSGVSPGGIIYIWADTHHACHRRRQLKRNFS